MSKDYYMDLKFQMAKLVGLQKSLKRTRVKLNLEIQDRYDRCERNEVRPSERGYARYVPEVVRDIPRLIAKLRKVEHRILGIRNTINTIENEIIVLTLRHRLTRLEQMKTIKVRADKKTGDCYLKLSDFKNLIDTKKVKSYTLEPVDDDGPNNEGVRKALVLTFYDALGKVVSAGDK